MRQTKLATRQLFYCTLNTHYRIVILVQLTKHCMCKVLVLALKCKTLTSKTNTQNKSFFIW